MRFDAPLALLALLIVPLAVLLYLLLERRPLRHAVRFTNIEVLAGVDRGVRRRVHVPAALMMLALVCALAALARPQERSTTARSEASIALVVDTSSSMAADDVAPTRLAAARQAIGSFVARLPRSARVGLVLFASQAYVAVPLTRDRNELLRGLALARAPGPGTAIGDALARSVSLLEPALTEDDSDSAMLRPPAGVTASASPPAILLLSDGAQTRGRLAPMVGAARARDGLIPVHTVALGTGSGMISEGVVSLRVPPDPATLRRISQVTGGLFAAAMDEKTLHAVYDHLAFELGWETHYRDLDSPLLGLAALLALAGCSASLIVYARLP